MDTEDIEHSRKSALQELRAPAPTPERHAGFDEQASGAPSVLATHVDSERLGFAPALDTFTSGNVQGEAYDTDRLSGRSERELEAEARRALSAAGVGVVASSVVSSTSAQGEGEGGGAPPGGEAKK